MDTISRENNSSMLPVGGIIVGVVALLLSGYAAITLSKVNKTLATHEEKMAKIDDIERQAATASSDAARANKAISDNDKVYRSGFEQVGNSLVQLTTDVTTLKESAKKPAPAAAGGKAAAGPVVAGPDEYVIKGGDTFAKIAAAQGMKVADIVAVNPGVNPSALHPGQKIKLPKK